MFEGFYFDAGTEGFNNFKNEWGNLVFTMTDQPGR